jgi:hypothetical protein
VRGSGEKHVVHPVGARALEGDAAVLFRWGVHALLKIDRASEGVGGTGELD